jgi:Tfp pilus assembly protein PilX
MKKGIVLIVVMGILLVVVSLCVASVYIMGQQGRIAEHKITRMRLFYAAQAGMVRAFDELQQNNKYKGEDIYIGAGEEGYPSSGIKVNIDVKNNSGIDKTDLLTINASTQ